MVIYDQVEMVVFHFRPDLPQPPRQIANQSNQYSIHTWTELPKREKKGSAFAKWTQSQTIRQSMRPLLTEPSIK